jgi:hypothetical protein
MHRCIRGSLFLALALGGCGSSSGSTPSSAGGGSGTAKDPATAQVVSIDRFSDAFAHLFKRSTNSALPAANAAVDFDQGPFVTQGLGPSGETIRYYNFDVLPTAPAPIYVFFREGSTTELTEQLHVVDVIPGEPGYNDFWRVIKVTVPASYVPNSATSLADIKRQAFRRRRPACSSTARSCPTTRRRTSAIRRRSRPRS